MPISYDGTAEFPAQIRKAQECTAIKAQKKASRAYVVTHYSLLAPEKIDRYRIGKPTIVYGSAIISVQPATTLRKPNC